ncbi:MAG: hypothetical protein U0P30_18105 [Vicinamibacterales bacterium]
MTTLPPPGQASASARWHEALTPGPDCLPTERLDATLTAAETAHVAGCARCQTELELFRSFEANTPVEGEGLAVAWIAAETKRRLTPAAPVPAVRPAWRLRSWALMAASVAVIAGGAVLLMRPAGPVAVPDTAPVYRGAQITIDSAGELAAAPESLSWTAVDGAVNYDLRLLEVDGTELWHTATSSPTVSVPADARAAFLPGRTLVWRVEARDAGGRTIVSSGDTRARVRPAGAPASGR